MSATEILQEFLDSVGQSILDEDFAYYSSRVLLPFELVTAAAQLQVETLDALHDGFDDFCGMLRDTGVTTLLRKVIHASFDGKYTIVGAFGTIHLKDSIVVVPRFFSKTWLLQVDGVWKSSKIQNTTQDRRWPVLTHNVPSPSWPPVETLK